VVIFERDCEAGNQRSAALARYTRKHLVHHVLHPCQPRCVQTCTASVARQTWVPRMLRGYATAVKRLDNDGRLAPQAMILPLDIDEFLVLNDASRSLRSLRAEMLAQRVCTSFVGWHLFGSSGHACQPRGGLLASFTRRGKLEEEVTSLERQAAIDASAEGRLNPPFASPYLSSHGVEPGKPLWLHGVAANCNLHQCRNECLRTDFRPCNGLVNSSVCVALRQYAHLNHYAFQSTEVWEQKKANQPSHGSKMQRSGMVPPFFDLVRDVSAVQAVRQAIDEINSGLLLRSCLARLLLDGSGRVEPMECRARVEHGDATNGPRSRVDQEEPGYSPPSVAKRLDPLPQLRRLG